MTYSARYRMPGQLFWRKAKRLRGDAIQDGCRILIFETEEQLHLPLTAEVKFDADRFWMIKKRMEAEAGQPITVETAIR